METRMNTTRTAVVIIEYAKNFWPFLTATALFLLISADVFILHDMEAAIDTLDTMIIQRPSYKQNLCLDKGYDFPEIEKEITKRRYIPHIRHRGEERLIELRYSAKRWVVERTNSWHNRFRKLLVRYEKKSENYLTLVCLACCIIVYRRTILG